MKIVLITGSPRKRGTSNFLAEHFIKSAEEAGHEIYRFDAQSSLSVREKFIIKGATE